jgi:hypothetical protein
MVHLDTANVPVFMGLQRTYSRDAGTYSGYIRAKYTTDAPDG